ncbi:MAG: Arm DNA-binding domain-containing protein, partial [Mucinivorans sp.]
MKQDSLSILFFTLKGRLLKNGEAPIILRVTLNGREDQMRVLRSVPMQLWNRAKG